MAHNTEARKSKMMYLGLYSVYAKQTVFLFDPKIPKGQIWPCNLIGKRMIYYFGLQEDFRIMVEQGFDFLDSACDHPSMIKAIEKIGLIVPYLMRERNMCIPYLICGQKEKATAVVESRLKNPRYIAAVTQTWEGDPKAEDKAEELQDYRDLAEAVSSKEKLCNLMTEYYQRNQSFAKQFGLPFPTKNI